MKERLLGFAFVAIFLVLGYNFAIDHIHTAFFSASLGWQRDWIVPYVAVPAALLLLLALSFGFYRKGSTLWGNAGATALIAVMIYLTLGAGYSCWHYCF